MRFSERVRNWIEGSRTAGVIYDALTRNRIYQALVLRRIESRIAWLERRPVRAFMLEVSSLCNARCSFCPHGGLTRKKQIMSTEVFDAIVGRIRAESITPSILDLFHLGEPLLDRHLFDRIRTLKRLFPAAWVRFTTNLNLADDRIIEEMTTSGLDSVHVSLNATSAETYRELMGLDYERTARNVHRLIEQRNASGSSLKVLVSMVIHGTNEDQVRPFIREWAALVDSIKLQRALDWGGAIDVASGSRRYAPGKVLFPCNDLFERIVITSEGTLALCCQDPEGVPGLSILDRPILEAFSAPPFEAMRRAHLAGEIRSIRKCVNCFGVNSNGANWLFERRL
ncbi:MAG: radical SAM protein [Candidatus Riflebacteria bacterium]|nr:radical SAM protein [Candidatus Riflebacteria bacterium]